MGQVRTWLARNRERLAVWTLVIVLLAVVSSLLYFAAAFHGSEASIQAVQTDDRINLEQKGGGYVLSPADRTSDVGLVFYPGARVHPDAYLSVLAPLVTEANATVVIPKMPLNLAVLDQGAAADIIGQHDVEQWYVGGHSLGGAMACRYASENQKQVSGVVLFGSYCDRSISDSGLRVLSVVGKQDTVLDWNSYENNKENLPANATVAELAGLNHTQFGSYTGQPGDEPSGTADAVAHRRLANVTVPWFRQAAENATQGVSRVTESHSTSSPTSPNTIRLRTP